MHPVFRDACRLYVADNHSFVYKTFLQFGKGVFLLIFTYMKIKLRSAQCTEGRRMAGARGLWIANGMKREMFGKPIIAIANSFTQLVPGHTHLHEAGQIVKAEIEKLGCYAAEFNTIAIDDGIAMGHDGMLYSLPSRDIIADSVEYMCNAHKVDALVCISNCDKITPGMLMAAMRLNIPTIFVSGGPMEKGTWKNENLDLVIAMVKAADNTVGDDELAEIEKRSCPGCGSCSGMFTANSMNSLTEAIGLSLPGNGTILATHVNRVQLLRDAARQIVASGRFMIFLLVTTYTLGIILLSYSFLDGMLRVYMIALSLLCYKLALKVAFSLIDVLVFVMLRVILHPFTKFWRRNT